MFCSRQTNNMINQLHQTSKFETLFVEDSDICNNHRNIQTLIMTEAYKIQNNLAPLIMETICLKEKSCHII